MTEIDDQSDAYMRTEETYRQQFAVSAADERLPPGFVRFHSETFSKFLQ